MVIWKEFNGDLESLYNEVGKEKLLVMYRFSSDITKPFECRIARVSKYVITTKDSRTEKYQIQIEGITGKTDVSHYSIINDPE